MKSIILSMTIAFAGVCVSPAVSAETDRDSLKHARAVKLYIAKEHRKRKSDPSDDFDKLHKLCGRSKGWTKGCRFWKAKGGKDEYMFQVRSTKKIYGIPTYLLR